MSTAMTPEERAWSSAMAWRVIPPSPWLSRLRDAAWGGGAAAESSSTAAAFSQEALAASTSSVNNSLASSQVGSSASTSTPTRLRTEHARGGAKAKARARMARGGRARAKSKSSPKAKARVRVLPATRWGRCWMCRRALMVRVRHADGSPFLSCPRYPRCRFAQDVPAALEHQLPDYMMVRHRVDF